MYNVTLRGGITAGKFRDRGVLPNVEECLRICCIAKSCDLAFMLGNHCFSVSCKTQALCEVATARSSTYNPRVAYIYARSNFANRSYEPTNSSTAPGGLTHAKNLVLQFHKAESSSMENINHSIVTANSKKQRKYKNINETVSENHRNRSRSGYAKDKLQPKNFTEKMKLENKSKNEYDQTTENLKDIILLQAFQGTEIPRNSRNKTLVAETDKNITNESDKNGSLSASNVTSDHDTSLTLNTKGVETGNIPSMKMVANNRTSKKVFQPATRNVTSLLSYSRAPNLKDFLKNTTFLQTHRYQTISLQEKASGAPDSSLRKNLQVNPLPRKPNQRNRTSKYDVTSLEEMVSETIPSSLAHDSEETPFSRNSGEKNRTTSNQIVSISKSIKLLPVNNNKKDGRPKNRIVSMEEMVSEPTDSASNRDLKKEYHFEQDNHINITRQNQTASLQMMTSQTTSSPSVEYVSGHDKDNGKDIQPVLVNSTDLMLLEAFSLQPQAKYRNFSDGDFPSKLSVSSFSPTTAPQSRTRGTKIDRLDVKPNTENKTTKSRGTHKSMLKTITKLKTTAEDKIRYPKDTTNNLSKSFQQNDKKIEHDFT